MITSGQIRAARSLIKWTGKELAEASGVAFSTLMRLETGEGIPAAQAKTLNAIVCENFSGFENLIASPS